MIRVALPPLPNASNAHAVANGKALLRNVARMAKAEAWQTAAVVHGFAFDPSAMPDPPHTFTAAAGRLARSLFGRWATSASPIPRTIASDGVTETTWSKCSGVPLFVVETGEEQRRVYLGPRGLVSAVFPLRRVEVARFGRYTTGRLGGRTARTVAEALGDEPLDTAATLKLWPLTPSPVTPYSVLARTLLGMAAMVLRADAPELLPSMEAIDFGALVDDGLANLTVEEVHAY